jgi:hypothetical protein
MAKDMPEKDELLVAFLAQLADRLVTFFTYKAVCCCKKEEEEKEDRMARPNGKARSKTNILISTHHRKHYYL